MNKLTALAIAGVVLAGGAQAQAPAPPADPSTATPAVVQPKADPDMSAAARTRTAEAGMARALNDVTAGMGVKSASGESIGTVRDIVPAKSGRPDYVVIATAHDGSSAVPYAAVAPMIKDGAIILDPARLKSAPKVNLDDLHDQNNTAWRKQADRYWGVPGSNLR
jgi:hypothetical protein